MAEQWGPSMFARRVRSRLATRHVLGPVEGGPPETPVAGAPSQFNIVLLGPTGSGKSSMTYTWWRAVTGGPGDEEMFSDHSHQSLLRKLRLGWTTFEMREEARKEERAAALAARDEAMAAGDSTEFAATPAASPDPQPALAIAARHGTDALASFQVQARSAQHSAIVVQDTKGQQFFDEAEEKLADELLAGKLQDGSTAEARHYRYWFMLGHFGVVSTASLATTPHAVVLVFNASLRSFREMLEAAEGGEDGEDGEDALQLYRGVVAKASAGGHEVFVVLTHADVIGAPAGEGESAGAGADRPTAVEFQSRVAAALGGGVTDAHVAVIENYRQHRARQDPALDVVALELLEAVVNACDRYIQAHLARSRRGPGCVVS